MRQPVISTNGRNLVKKAEKQTANKNRFTPVSREKLPIGRNDSIEKKLNKI